MEGRLIAAVQNPGHAYVTGPGAISAPPRTQLQPDLLVSPARFGPRLDWAKVTEHWLAVEVLSRSSRVYDREVKRGAYFALGVPELWLVDWRARSVEVWRPGRAPEEVRDVIRWRVPALDLVVPIDLSEAFEGLDG